MLCSSFSMQALDPTARTVWEVLQSGGPVMVPIAICSVVVVGLTLERFFRLTRKRVCPAVVGDAVDKITGGDIAAAEAALGEVNAPGVRVLRAGMRRRGFALRDVEGAFEDQGRKEANRMLRNVRTLVLIAAVTPLLGLLGTVLGIAESFRRVSASGMGKPELLAGGIDEALTTTIAGLCVAIPAMLLGAYLKGRASRLIARLDDVVSPAVEALAANPSATNSVVAATDEGSTDAA